MRIPYGYILSEDGEFQIDEHKAEHVQMIFAYYLSGASLGKVVDMLCSKGIASPTGNLKWTRAAIDKLLSNRKYIPVVGMETCMDVQYEKEARAMSTMIGLMPTEKPSGTRLLYWVAFSIFWPWQKGPSILKALCFFALFCYTIDNGKV